MDKLNFSDVVKCVFLAAALATCAGPAIAQAKSDESASLGLDKKWEFRQVTPGAPDDNGEWLPATVPGDVHLDLLANKKIPDPFYRDNEAKLRNLTYLVPVKEVHLKPADLSVETTGENETYRIRITSPVLARSVYLSFGNLDVGLSDNYFDLLPGETVEIQATGASSLADLKAQLKVISLVDAFAPEFQPPAATATR